MEFEIKGNEYRAAKLSVFDQFKVTRKLLPVLAGILGDFQSLKGMVGKGDTMAIMETMIPKIADSLSALSDDDANAVIYPCLAVVARKHGKNWTPIFVQGELMFDDIDLIEMLQLVGRVVGDSLGNFLRELPATETQPPNTPAA